MKKKLKLGQTLQPTVTKTVVIISVPGADKPWFVYDKVKNKSSHGFKTLKAAEQYLIREFQTK